MSTNNLQPCLALFAQYVDVEDYQTQATNQNSRVTRTNCGILHDEQEDSFL